MVVPTRVIPGVSIEVIEEIVPRQLYPSGIVGLIGLNVTGKPKKLKAFSSYKEVKAEYGEPDTSRLVEEARLLFMNGVSEIFVLGVGEAGSIAPFAEIKERKGKIVLRIQSRVFSKAHDGFMIKLMKSRSKLAGHFDLEIMRKQQGGGDEVLERHENLSADVDVENFVVKVLANNSRFVTATITGSEKSESEKSETLAKESGSKDSKKEKEAPDSKNELKAELIFEEGIHVLSGGKSAIMTNSDIEGALGELELEPSIDVVYACDEGNRDIHRLVEAHCRTMSLSSEGGLLGPRIGIGSVAPGETVEDTLMKQELKSKWFVTIAPYGFASAVAGLISRLSYYEAPTFKTISIPGNYPEERYTSSEIKRLLTAGVLTVDVARGKGIFVVHGITTSSDQISVRRVVHHAVRGVKNISDNFIGTLNNSSGRMALKERIREFLMAMEREGSIVPSTDGKKPSYQLDVYSSQDDFAKGIVRVDVAVRPVRAIDYIYSTINVQAY